METRQLLGELAIVRSSGLRILDSQSFGEVFRNLGVLPPGEECKQTPLKKDFFFLLSALFSVETQQRLSHKNSLCEENDEASKEKNKPKQNDRQSWLLCAL